MKLIELQRWMGKTVTQPLTFENRLDRNLMLPDSTVSDVDKIISPSTKLTAIERLEIYNRGFWFRVLDSMGEDFPAVRALVGEDEFKTLVVRYIRSNPSTNWTLRNLGMKFEPWLRSASHSSGPLLVAADVARLEWAYIESYDAPEDSPLDPIQHEQSGAALKLRLQSHVQLLRVDYSVHEFVAAVHDGEGATPTVFPKQTEFLAIYRRDFVVTHISLPPFGFLVLHGLRHWQTLEDVFNAELSHQSLSQNDVQQIGKQFQEWSRLGFFTSREISGEESND